MRNGQMPQGVDHRTDDEAECKRDADETYGTIAEGVHHHRPGSDQDQEESTDGFGDHPARPE
jgi:hypothetical protein